MNKRDNYNLSIAYLQNNIQATSAMLEAASTSLKSIISYNFETEPYIQLMESISRVSSVANSALLESVYKNLNTDSLVNTCQTMLSQLSSVPSIDFDFSAFATGLSIYNDSVSLSNEAIDNILEFYEEADTEAPTEIKSTVSKIELIGLIITIFLGLASLIQNDYYQRINSLDAQKSQMIEAEYHAELMEIESQQTKELEELNNNLTELLQYLELAQDTPPSSPSTPTQPSDVQETPSESVAVDHESVDESQNPDVH